MDRRLVWSLFLGLGIAAGCTSSGSPSAPTAASPAPSAASATATPAVPSASLDALPSKVDIESAGALAIAATGNVDWLVLVDGLAWVTGVGAGIESVDATGAAKQSVRIDGSCESMDVGFDAIWSASCEPAGIIRIDPKTGAVTRKDFDVPIPDSEASVGAAEGGVWIVAGATSDLLLQIDPQTLEVMNRYPIPAESAAVRAGLGGIWITRPRADELLHVDPSSGAVVATVAVGPGPVFLAVGEGSVWVMNQGDGTVSRVDPATDTVIATIDVGAPIRGGDIAVGGGSVWVRGGPELLARIDPAINMVIERYGPDSGSGSVAADDDAVWVTAHDVSKMWRLPLTRP